MLLCLAVVDYRRCMLYCEGEPLWTWMQHAAHVVAVTSQLCAVVVSCCSGSMVGQLFYCLGWIVGYEYLHVTVRGLVAIPNQ